MTKPTHQTTKASSFTSASQSGEVQNARDYVHPRLVSPAAADDAAGRAAIDQIVIVNLTRGEQYSCRKTCTTISIEGKRPKAPPRMRRVAGLNKLEKPVEGFHAYLWSGTTQTVIPDLNFFALDLRATRVSEKYSNIRVAQQPPELFERPSQSPEQ